MAAKSKAKKPAPAKKAPAKAAKPAPKKKVAPVKNSKAAVAKPAAKASPKAAAPVKAAGKGPAPASKKEQKAVVEKVVDKKRAKANAAMEAALAETAEEETSPEDEEFDPEKFFALNGGQGLIKSHTMRKERVDFNISIRYRFMKGPLVYQAELINLSKGGLALKTTDIIKAKTVIKIEIPLPHTSELFAVQAEVIWSTHVGAGEGSDKAIHTGLRFLPMSIAKQAVINQFIQQRRDEVIMAKIGLDRFVDSVPVAGLD